MEIISAENWGKLEKAADYYYRAVV